MLTGNLVAIAVGGLVASISSVIWPDNFDFNITRRINVGPIESYEGDIPGTEDVEEEKKGHASDHGSSSPKEVHHDTVSDVLPDDMDPTALKKAFNFAVYSSIVLVRCPVSMFSVHVEY